MSSTQNQDSNTSDEGHAQSTSELTNVTSNSNIQVPSMKNRVRKNTKRHNNRQPRTGSRPIATNSVETTTQRGVIGDIIVLTSSAE